MKKSIILLLLYLSLSQCHKSDESSYNEPPVQYFKCVLNDNIQYDFVANDSVEIFPSSSMGYGSNKTNITYGFTSNIQIGHKLDKYQTAYDNIDVSFITTPHSDEIDWENRIGVDKFPVFKNNKFESFFQPGNTPFLEQKCPNLIVQPQVSFSSYYTSFLHALPETFIPYCNDPNNPEIHNEGNFTINKSAPYYHKKYGKCIVIEGKFELTQYSVSGTSLNQVFKITDGRFKLLVSEICFPY